MEVMLKRVYESAEASDGYRMRKDNPLATKSGIRAVDLKKEPLIVSAQSTSQNEIQRWMGDYRSLTVAADYNLPYNAAFLVEQGLGSMITFDGLVPYGTDFRPNLVFHPFIPALFSGNFIIWKKGRLLSKAAELLKQRMESCFS